MCVIIHIGSSEKHYSRRGMIKIVILHVNDVIHVANTATGAEASSSCTSMDMRRCVWLLQTTACLHTVWATCITDEDCSMLGRCDFASNSCNCSFGWTGDHCEVLDLDPLDHSHPRGLNLLKSNATSTWGGAVVPWRGQFVMMYSEIERHCGINAWLSNSVVRVAESKHPLGPYLPRPSVVFPIFSHEPTLALAPTGEIVMFFTHNDRPVTYAGTCNCTTGNSTAACPPDWDRHGGRNTSATLLTYMTYTLNFREWSTPVPVPQADPLTDTAFSATIFANGTLVAMTRTQVMM